MDLGPGPLGDELPDDLENLLLDSEIAHALDSLGAVEPVHQELLSTPGAGHWVQPQQAQHAPSPPVPQPQQGMQQPMQAPAPAPHPQQQQGQAQPHAITDLERSLLLPRLDRPDRKADYVGLTEPLRDLAMRTLEQGSLRKAEEGPEKVMRDWQAVSGLPLERFAAAITGNALVGASGKLAGKKSVHEGVKGEGWSFGVSVQQAGDAWCSSGGTEYQFRRLALVFQGRPQAFQLAAQAAAAGPRPDSLAEWQQLLATFPLSNTSHWKQASAKEAGTPGKQEAAATRQDQYEFTGASIYYFYPPGENRRSTKRAAAAEGEPSPASWLEQSSSAAREQVLKEELQRAVVEGDVPALEQLLPRAKDAGVALPDVKDCFDRGLLSLNFSVETEWPPGTHPKKAPVQRIPDCGTRITIYRLLTGIQGKGTGKKLGKEATKLSSTWCKMMTALNNNKCIPLFQLALYASDPPAELPQAAGSGVLGAGTTAAAAASPAAAGVGASAVLATAPGGAGGAGQHQQGQGQAPAKPSLLPLLQAVLEDVGSREGMLEGILMARSKDGWRPYHNAVKEGHWGATKALVETMVQVYEMEQKKERRASRSKMARTGSAEASQASGSAAEASSPGSPGAGQLPAALALFYHMPHKYYPGGEKHKHPEYRDRFEEVVAQVLGLDPEEVSLPTAEKPPGASSTAAPATAAAAAANQAALPEAVAAAAAAAAAAAVAAHAVPPT